MFETIKMMYLSEFYKKCQKMVYELKEAYIELYKLLKMLNLSATGGHAKLLIDEGFVKLNGKVESRKRAKIRIGDIVECDGQEIKIV